MPTPTITTLHPAVLFFLSETYLWLGQHPMFKDTATCALLLHRKGSAILQMGPQRCSSVVIEVDRVSGIRLPATSRAYRQSASPNRLKSFTNFLPLIRQQWRNPSRFPTTLPILPVHGLDTLSLLATQKQRIEPHVHFGQLLGIMQSHNIANKFGPPGSGGSISISRPPTPALDFSFSKLLWINAARSTATIPEDIRENLRTITHHSTDNFFCSYGQLFQQQEGCRGRRDAAAPSCDAPRQFAGTLIPGKVPHRQSFRGGHDQVHWGRSYAAQDGVELRSLLPQAPS